MSAFAGCTFEWLVVLLYKQCNKDQQWHHNQQALQDPCRQKEYFIQTGILGPKFCKTG